ncbi:MBL fold metallo-hydrolase [Afifella pfennigii]|uniref:MBL fold metallo-hydrolase n=1 Tax=Afifella pfennigii TaxID=209897 RepID=UPI000A007F18|nr:MBL fold metallo-hydrolase [Afifella pfennigii]
MTEPASLSIRFWGVRGSYAVPGPATVRYGGNTSCMEVCAGEECMIVDCGSGVHNLGEAMLEEGKRSATVLFTHTHLDHICGLPFFRPAYREDFRVRFMAGHLPTDIRLQDIFERLMDPVLFPVQPAVFKDCAFQDIAVGETMRFGNGLTVTSECLNHTGGAIGYRFDFKGRSIVIVTDHEHGNKAIDEALERFVAGADIMVYDATYTDEEYRNYVGWGHSTWQEALKLAEKAGVRQPVLFHHHPERSDDDLDALRATIRTRFAMAEIAREGMRLEAGKPTPEAATTSTPRREAPVGSR